MNLAMTRFRIVSAVLFVITVVLGTLGVVSLVPDSGLDGDLVFWIPAATAILGLFAVHFVIDPLLLPRGEVTSARAARMSGAMIGWRLAVAELPLVAGLAVGVGLQSDPAVILGCGASVVLLVHWWPGRGFRRVIRMRLAPKGAAGLVGGR